MQSFAKLGEECRERKECKQHKCPLSSCESETGVETAGKICKVCEENEQHLEIGRKSRELYQKDASLNTSSEETYFSIDMPKVLVLLHLPGIKNALSTRRIIIINQSIVQPGSLKKTNGTQNNNSNKKSMGFLWQEAIQRRREENAASVVIKFLREPCCRDCKK